MELGFISNGDPADLEIAQSIGYTNVELAFFPGTGPINYQQKNDFAKSLKSSPIKVSAVSIFGDPHPLSRNDAESQASADRFSTALDIAVAVDAPVIYCGSGELPEEDASDPVMHILDVFSRRIEKVTATGKSFAFYNCGWSNVVNKPEVWELVLPHLDAGIKYDPSHPVYDDRDYLAELVEWGKHVRHAHAKDVLKIGGKMHSDPNPGFGQIQWGPFFTLLYEAGYEGAVTVEPHSKLWTTEKRTAGLKASYRYLSQFILD